MPKRFSKLRGISVTFLAEVYATSEVQTQKEILSGTFRQRSCHAHLKYVLID